MALTSVGRPEQAQDNLEKVLRKLDAAASEFHAAKAGFQWDTVQTEPVPDKETQKGSIYFERKGAEIAMAAHIDEVNGKPVPKDLVYSDGQLQLYEPLIKQLKVFKAGANRGVAESFLTLGFGESGKDLEKNFTIQYLKSELLDGFQTDVLDLVPKAENLRKSILHETIWIDSARGVSLKQIVYQPSDTYRVCVYFDMKLNAAAGLGKSKDPFKLQLLPGTTTINAP